MKFKIANWVASVMLALGSFAVWADPCPSDTLVDQCAGLSESDCPTKHTSQNFCRVESTENHDHCLDDTSRLCDTAAQQ
jgi:hypothetical protein